MSQEQTRLEKDFMTFHKANPQVRELFKSYTLLAIEQGRKRYSARLVVEKIRWDSGLTTDHHSFFKIPNAHSTYYARLFHAVYPSYKGIFLTQEFYPVADDFTQVPMELLH